MSTDLTNIGLPIELMVVGLEEKERVALEARTLVNQMLERFGRRPRDLQLAAVVTAVAHTALTDWALHPQTRPLAEWAAAPEHATCGGCKKRYHISPMARALERAICPNCCPGESLNAPCGCER